MQCSSSQLWHPSSIPVSSSPLAASQFSLVPLTFTSLTPYPILMPTLQKRLQSLLLPPRILQPTAHPVHRPRMANIWMLVAKSDSQGVNATVAGEPGSMELVSSQSSVSPQAAPVYTKLTSRTHSAHEQIRLSIGGISLHGFGSVDPGSKNVQSTTT